MSEAARKTTSPAERRPWQFSLRTALLLVAFAAIGFSLWVSFGQWRENRRLRAELIRMKDRVGELEIAPGQEHKVHAVRMPTLEPMTWKWSIYIPEGRNFCLNSGTMLDKTSFGGSEIPAGNYTITIAVRRNHLNEWKLIELTEGEGPTYRGSGNTQIAISETLAKQIEEPNEASSSGVSGNAAAEPGNDLELLRFRMRPPVRGVPIGKDFLQGPHEGILVWITEK